MHELIKQLTFVNVPVFPCHDNKQPAIQGGFKSASTTPGTYWPSNLFGIPVPLGVLIIDIDAYKGMTTDKIEQVLGCTLDWDASFIQRTPSGGMHHAFHTNEELQQGSDLFAATIGKGFDTRVAGRGYICAGEGYTPIGEMGPLALAVPDTLPRLPPAATIALTAQAATQHQPAPLPTGDRNADEINKMLQCLDADCGRDEWMKVSLALKHHYHDDDITGFTLFDNWSMSSPDVYDPAQSRKLWDTIKPTRENGQPTVTLGTLVHKAIEHGYVPGRSAEEVFGGGPSTAHSAPVVDIETLLATINERGGQPESIDELTSAIRMMTCSDIQRAALTATLQRVLRTHNIKITDTQLRKACQPDTIVPFVFSQLPSEITHFQDLEVQPVQALGNVHIMNASMLRQALFTSRLSRFGSEPYWWNGCSWESVTKTDLAAKVAHAFIDNEYGKDGNINGTRNQLLNLIPAHKNINPPTTRIFFKNGVFDPLNPAAGLLPHDPNNFNASTLTVDYGPHASQPHWDEFLNSIFHAEPTRITLLQEIMGWWLISDNLNHQKAVAFDGVSRSGKGTILAMVNAILGDGMTDVSVGQLAQNKLLSSLRTATLGVDRDAKRPPIRDAAEVHSNFNKITANEPISIPIIYSPDPWRGELNCKYAVACNGIPVMMDDSGASPGRWIVLKFTESMLGREDLGLGKRLMTEKSAVAAWAVTGLIRLMKNGTFTLPESSIEESNAIVESSSPVAQFADDCLDINLQYSTHTTPLWDSYLNWCQSTNNKPPNRNQFLNSLKRVLQSHGVTPSRAIKLNGTVSPGMRGVQLKIHTGANVTPITGSTTASDAFKP